MRELPGSLFTDAAAASLGRVQILGNGITAVTPGWLNGCGRLTELSLDRNRIRALPDRTFEGALSLPELRLFLNDITKCLMDGGRYKNEPFPIVIPAQSRNMIIEPSGAGVGPVVFDGTDPVLLD